MSRFQGISLSSAYSVNCMKIPEMYFKVYNSLKWNSATPEIEATFTKKLVKTDFIS